MFSVNLPVCKWGYHKSLSAAQKLILVDEVHISDGDDTFVLVFYEVKPGLLQPFKVCRRLDVQAALQK